MALDPNNRQILFSDAMYFNKKLFLILLIVPEIGGRPSATRRSLTTGPTLVPRILAAMRYNTKSRDFLSDELTGHAFKPYKRQGKHLALNKRNTTATEELHQILP